MDFQSILTKQEAFKVKHGRYFQVIKGGKKNTKEKETVDMQGIPNDIEIHEHKCPDGSVGFTVYETKTENGKEYRKATGSGCGSNTSDWFEIKQ
mgnify:CR=1 FL=1|jgi:hypothetical protein|tara:strand:- start:1960 stop:2241 length:282 start_codon:yes stop_codon:yes gene_type:complete